MEIFLSKTSVKPSIKRINKPKKIQLEAIEDEIRLCTAEFTSKFKNDQTKRLELIYVFSGHGIIN